MTEPHLDSLGRRNRGWTKPGPGRHKLYAEQVTFMIDSDTYSALMRIKGALACSTIAETARTVLMWGIESHDKS